MRRFFNWLLILAAVGGVIAALTYPTMAWWRERNAPKFLTAQVTKGRVETVVNSSGTVKPVRTVSVGAFTSGPIKEVKVDFNTWITKREQVLALIDDKLQTANVKRDEAAVKTQKAEKERTQGLLDQAILNEGRAKELRKKNAQYISDTEMDDFKYKVVTLKAQLKLAEASIEQAEANLQNATDQLGYTEIKGPKEIDFDTNTDPKTRVKGRVIDRKVDPGQTVAATFQTPELFTIALEMDRHMHVYAAVDEADIGMIRAGRDRHLGVTFTVDTYPGELFNGTIYAIRLNSTTTQNVVTYPVVIDAPNVFDKDRQELKLKPGMTANITFPIEAKENALRVPTSALRFTPAPAQVHPDDRHYLEAITTSQAIITGKRSADEKAELAKGRQRRIVWVQEDKWLRAVPVVLGLMEHQHAEIVRGDLTEGQAVVTGMEGNVAPLIAVNPMSLIDLLLISLRTLGKNKLRSGLTILGVVIGIAAVMTMVSIGQGASELVKTQFKNLGSNVIVVTPASSQSGGVRSGLVMTLTKEDTDAIANECPSVLAVSPLAGCSGQVIAEGINWSPKEMFGVGPDYVVVRNWPMASGSFFTEKDVVKADQVCVLGQTVANQLFPREDPVAQKKSVRVKNIPMRVIGVLSKKGANLVGQDQDDIVLMPYSTVRKRIEGSMFANVGFALVSARSEELTNQAVQEIRSLLTERHRIPAGEKPDFEVRNMAEVENILNMITGALTAMLSAIAAISLVVGGVGIMNIMLVSVTERTREIGIRMALGARPRDILWQFLVESAVLSSVGGVIGIALGVAASAGITGLINIVLPSSNWPFVVSIPAAIVALIFAAAVGLFFGYYPARRASRLDPIDALRYD